MCENPRMAARRCVTLLLGFLLLARCASAPKPPAPDHSETRIAADEGCSQYTYCSPSGFCPEWPRSPRAITSLWSPGPGEVWATSTGGAIFAFKEGSWTRFQTPTDVILKDLWGVSPQRAWAVGQGGVLLSYDGREWKQESLSEPPDFEAIHGSSAEDVWAVGSGGLVHFDGKRWTKYPSQGFVSANAVQVLSPTDAWAISRPRTVMHWNGTDWSTVPGTPQEELQALHVRSPSEIDLTTFPGHLYRWDGAAFQKVPQPLEGKPISFNDLDSSPNALWLVGAQGTAIALTDAGVVNAQLASDEYVSDVAMGSDGTAWISSSAGLYRSHGEQLERVSAREPPAVAAAASGSTIYVAAEDGQVRMKDGASWKLLPPSPERFARALWVDGKYVWLAGRGVNRFDGTRWESFSGAAFQNVNVIWGADGEVFLGGQGVARWTPDGGFVSILPPSQTVSDIWGTSSKDVWITGDGAGVRSWNGSAWSEPYARAPELGAFSSVWGSAADDVYLTGRNAVLHWNGADMVELLRRGQGFFRVGGSGRNDVWMSGEQRIVHYDGASWSRANVGASSIGKPLTVGGALYVVGDGALLRRCPGRAKPVTFPPEPPYRKLPLRATDRDEARAQLAAFDEQVHQEKEKQRLEEEARKRDVYCREDIEGHGLEPFAELLQGVKLDPLVPRLFGKTYNVIGAGMTSYLQQEQGSLFGSLVLFGEEATTAELRLTSTANPGTLKLEWPQHAWCGKTELQTSAEEDGTLSTRFAIETPVKGTLSATFAGQQAQLAVNAATLELREGFLSLGDTVGACGPPDPNTGARRPGKCFTFLVAANPAREADPDLWARYFETLSASGVDLLRAAGQLPDGPIRTELLTSVIDPERAPAFGEARVHAAESLKKLRVSGLPPSLRSRIAAAADGWSGYPSRGGSLGNATLVIEDDAVEAVWSGGQRVFPQRGAISLRVPEERITCLWIQKKSGWEELWVPVEVEGIYTLDRTGVHASVAVPPGKVCASFGTRPPRWMPRNESARSPTVGFLGDGSELEFFPSAEWNVARTMPGRLELNIRKDQGLEYRFVPGEEACRSARPY